MSLQSGPGIRETLIANLVPILDAHDGILSVMIVTKFSSSKLPDIMFGF